MACHHLSGSIYQDSSVLDEISVERATADNVFFFSVTEEEAWTDTFSFGWQAVEEAAAPQSPGGLFGSFGTRRLKAGADASAEVPTPPAAGTKR